VYSLETCNTPRGMLVTCAVGAAMGLTRYVGMPFAIVGVLCLVASHRTLYAVLCGSLPVLVFGAWLARNFSYTGLITGHAVRGVYGEASVWTMVGVLVWWIQLTIAFGGGMTLCALCWRLAARRMWPSFSSVAMSRASTNRTSD
jgi:hypothetical protein